jgi:hypothetical protein
MEELVAMTEVSVVLGSGALFAAGVLAWFTLWRRRAARALQRVPVSTARSVRAARSLAEGRRDTA